VAHQRRCRHARPWALLLSLLQIGHARPSQLPATHAWKPSRCVAPPRRRRSSSVTGVRDAADCNLGKERRLRTHIRAGCVCPMGDRDGSRTPTRCRRTFCTWAWPKCCHCRRQSPLSLAASRLMRIPPPWVNDCHPASANANSRTQASVACGLRGLPGEAPSRRARS